MASAHPSAGISRANRASTLPSQAGKAKQGQQSTESHHHHRHHISHRHHRSHQISTREPQSAVQPSSLTDLFSPVKEGLRDFGNRSAGAFSERDKDREREKGDAVPEQGEEYAGNRTAKGMEHVSMEDVKKAKEINDQTEAELSSQLSTLSTDVLSSASHLAHSHAELSSSLSTSYATITQLSNLLDETSSLFASFTTSSIPEVEASTRMQLQALERTYIQAEKGRLANLEKRVGAANEKVESLMKRLAKTKDDVEREEIREMSERRRHQRTVGLAWGALGFGLLIMVAFLVWQRSGVGVSLGQVGVEEENMLRARLKDQGVGWVLEHDRATDDSFKRKFGTRSKASGTVSRGKKEETGETLLSRLIDEL